MVKLRLKFSKSGPIRFLGHLDVMRYVQKAIRRAEIDIKYSEGYSPHQILSFAQPLGFVSVIFMYSSDTKRSKHRLLYTVSLW